jgi:hypothetical protein
LQARESLSVGQTTPPWALAFTTERARDWEPVLQVLVQVAQADQADTTQSMGQACSLHVFICWLWLHFLPPWATGVITLRERVWEPAAQDKVHALKAPQPETWQSTGHAWALQAWNSDSAGQVTPPNALCTLTPRWRVWVPEPQLLEQADQAAHWLTTQSIGQAVVLQDRRPVVSEQALPP